MLTVTTHFQAKRTAELADTSDSGLGADVQLKFNTKNDTNDSLTTDENLDIDDLDDSGVAVDADLLKSIEVLQLEDSEISEMRNFIEKSVLPEDRSRANVIARKRPLYQLIDGVLRHIDPHQLEALHVVVPGKLQTKVQSAYHDDPLSGHQGVHVTYDRLRKQFYWDGMYTDVVSYIHRCDSCLRNKGGPYPHRVPLNPLSIGDIFDRMGTDIAGPIPETLDGNRYIIAFIDYLTKYAVTVAIPDGTATTIARAFVTSVFSVFGPPTVLLSDKGANFLSPIVTEVCKLLWSQRATTSGYHPATNGLCERFWSSLKTMLRMYVNEDQDNWDEMLPLVTYSYNMGMRSSTGYTPYELVFGHQPHLPIDLLLIPRQDEMSESPELVQKLAAHLKKIQNVAKSVNKMAQTKMKIRYDANTKDQNFAQGDLVLR